MCVYTGTTGSAQALSAQIGCTCSAGGVWGPRAEVLTPTGHPGTKAEWSNKGWPLLTRPITGYLVMVGIGVWGCSINLAFSSGYPML